MRSRLLHDEHGRRAFFLVLETGDDAIETLLAWAAEHRVRAARIDAIGAFASVTLGYFDVETREYARIDIDEQVEVLSLAGNIALVDDKPKAHAHVVIGKRNGGAHGGHLLAARVRPTLEMSVTELGQPLHRTTDAATGLPLLNLDR